MLLLMVVAACGGSSRDFSLLLLEIYDKCLYDGTTTWNVVTKTVGLLLILSLDIAGLSHSMRRCCSCKAIVSSRTCYCID